MLALPEGGLLWELDERLLYALELLEDGLSYELEDCPVCDGLL